MRVSRAASLVLKRSSERPETVTTRSVVTTRSMTRSVGVCGVTAVVTTAGAGGFLCAMSLALASARALVSSAVSSIAGGSSVTKRLTTESTLEFKFRATDSDAEMKSETSETDCAGSAVTATASSLRPSLESECARKDGALVASSRAFSETPPRYAPYVVPTMASVRRRATRGEVKRRGDGVLEGVGEEMVTVFSTTFCTCGFSFTLNSSTKARSESISTYHVFSTLFPFTFP